MKKKKLILVSMLLIVALVLAISLRHAEVEVQPLGEVDTQQPKTTTETISKEELVKEFDRIVSEKK